MSLLSLTTIWHNTVLPTLIVLPSTPMVLEVEVNIISCYSATFKSAESQSSCSGAWQSTLNKIIIHQILMLDELVVKKWARWDNVNNKFQGTCHEPNHQIPLDFMSERELDLLCEALERV